MNKITNTANFETYLPQEIINKLSDAIILVDQQGNILASNKVANNLSEEMKSFVCSNKNFRGNMSQLESWQQPHRIPLDNNFLWIVPQIDVRAQATATLLEVFLKQLEANAPSHRAIALAISKSLGWQWVAVNRLINNDEFEIETWIDGDEVVGPFVEKLEGTACQIILEHGRFIYFNDIAEAFDDDEYSEIGAKVYAGLAYQVCGKVFGHIFALHDTDEIDIRVADAILTMAAELLGSHLTLKTSQLQASAWHDEASTDALTGLLNRRAFDDYAGQLDPESKLSLAFIDIDGMKKVNDQLGHEAGDKLLIDFSRGLKSISRQQDKIFRIGGDEFVIAMEYENQGLANTLPNRLQIVIDNYVDQSVIPIGASVGVGFLSETDGHFKSTLNLADRRMYQNKRARKVPISLQDRQD